ncbi:TfoX/Sxy family protein [Nocardioides salsibiostraticola]
MAYDEAMADRVRERIETADILTEKKMFGGLAFLLNGNMALAIGEEGRMMVRVTPEQFGVLVERDHVTPMAMGERTSKTFLRVDAEALVEDDDLEEWIGYGVALASALPPK